MLNLLFLLSLIQSFSSFASSITPKAPAFNIITVDTLLKKNSHITYTKFHDPIPFEFAPLSISVFPNMQPNKGTLAESFILTIPHGRVCSKYGWVIADEKYMIRELFMQNYQFYLNVSLVNETPFENLRKVPGRVAVLTRRDVECYAHWIRDILGRLAMLELANIEFDWLYVPTDAPFMKETLSLWGIDPVKIIQPIDDFHYIEADELIVPSITRRIPTDSKTFQSTSTLASYWTPWIIEHIRNKFLPLAQQKIDKNKFSKKVFISRKDSTHRVMLNEDEVFNLFEQHGFKSYILSQMSFLEQVMLFANAEFIIAAHGSGLANLIFANPGTQIIEIFQARPDATECYLAQMCNLKYRAIGTSEQLYSTGFQNTTVPTSIIVDIINKLIK